MDEWRSPARGRIDLVPAARDTPDVDEIRNELGRIVASEALRNSLRLTRFITFVVETTLAGTDARIKAYTIAVEALGRAGNFDPQSDPIVRVEACRLRQALARYYAGAGRDDPLVIEVPRGTYVPSFRRRAATITLLLPNLFATSPSGIIPRSLSSSAVQGQLGSHFWKAPMPSCRRRFRTRK